MSIRLLSALLAAVALLFAPVAMARGGMVHAGSMQMTGNAGHCSDSSAPEKEEPGSLKLACANACAAWPADAPTFARVALSARLVPTPPRSHVLAGVPPERETPPPRVASNV